MTSTTVKRTSICLTREMLRQLNELCTAYKENPSQVMSRAILTLYNCEKEINKNLIKEDK